MKNRTMYSSVFMLSPNAKLSCPDQAFSFGGGLMERKDGRKKVTRGG